MAYRGGFVNKEALKLRTDDPDVREYVADLRRQYQYAGKPEDARQAVDRAMGASRLTDVLYESRQERPV